MIAPRQFAMADLFCGAGGTSTGAIEALNALGYSAKLTAVNHWDVAVATHTVNHPDARHLCASLDSLNPRDLFKPGELQLLWASPECTHHSVARGGKPINDQSRATAWCVTRWAEALLPPVILIENVPEFLTWGPCGSSGRPLKTRRGDTFRAWVASLESIGYKVDHRILCAADFGDPTTRRRLFIQAVRGRRRIVWPNPTHRPHGETDLFGDAKPWRAARECIDWNLKGGSIFDRKRPLKPKTMKRIMAGLEKFGGKPFLAILRGTSTTRDLELPTPTITSGGGHLGLVESFIVEVAHGDGNGPARTDRIKSINVPLGTVTCSNRFGLVEPFLINVAHAGGDRATSINAPVPTIPAGHRGEHALIEPFIVPMEHSGRGRLRGVSEPLPTITTAKGGAIGLCEPFLTSYYGNGGATSVDEPAPTVTTKDRFALVVPDGTTMDIRFRMLQPHELAAAQGFRSDYQFTGTKTDQVKQIGNAVPRSLAKSLVLAAVGQCEDISQFNTEAVPS